MRISIAGEHLLPHPRHAEEQGGLHVAQVGRERLAALAEVHDVPDVEALITEFSRSAMWHSGR